MRILENSIVRLLKNRPFYGQFLLQFRRQPYSGDKAVAVTIADAVPTLMVDPEHFAVFSLAEQDALLEHLIRHVLHLHPGRRKERNCRLWDLACDLAINPAIANLPPEAPLPRRFRLPAGLAAEEYYDKLMLLPELGNQEGSGVGDGHRSSAAEKNSSTAQDGFQAFNTSTVDDHQYWSEADRTPLSLAEQVVRQMVQTAWKRSREDVPDELRDLLNPYLGTPPIPWQQILRQFIGTAGRIGKTATWKRSHRRFERDTPGIRKKQYLNLVVAIDVSDSTDIETLREQFAQELLHITRGRQSRITLLYAGSRIQKMVTLSGQPQVTEVYRGGGFTDLRPVFDYAHQLQPRPAALIYLTDGYGPAPEYSDIPTLWVLSPDGVKPADWGVELRLKASELRHGSVNHKEMKP